VSDVLRIGVDARELLGATTGVGRYLGELMRRWTVRPDALGRQFVLYAPAPLPLAFPAGTVEQRVIGSGAGTWWEQTTLRSAVRSDRPHVFFAPAYTAPLAVGTPLAVTIHDLSFVAHPEWFRPRERWRRQVITARTAASASIIFTDSQFSRSELEDRLQVPPERVRVISPGVSGPTAGLGVRGSGLEEHIAGLGARGSGLEEHIAGLGVRDSGLEEHIAGPGPWDSGAAPREPLVLYVGSIFNRRRLPDLIAAFARATADMPAARLVIVGADRSWPAQDLAATAAAHGVGTRVDLRSYVGETELAQLYARASVFAFLSEYEGFGLTPLEALASGVPIVVADTPVAREVYGPAAEYVQPADVEGVSVALRRFLGARSAASEQLARAADVLARYSWDRAAAETLEGIERIAIR
jgi:glycosyltransferase involved in cell wall biosynthesis